MDETSKRFRIRLLGPFERFSSDGTRIDPTDSAWRKPDAAILAQLSLHGVRSPVSRAALKDTVELADRVATNQDVIESVSRLRGVRLKKQDKLPIEFIRTTDSYTLDLDRSEIDATYFIDQVDTAVTREVPLIKPLLALWRGNPFKLYPTVPSTTWRPLSRALERFVNFLQDVSPSARVKLPEIDRFLNVLEIESASPLVGRPKVLIVDDDHRWVQVYLLPQLHGYEVIPVYDYDAALPALARHHRDLSAALVDRHLLPDERDALGEQVLRAICEEYPTIPRILITSDHPDGADVALRDRYGLFAVITKGANASSVAEVRSLVEQMLHDRRRRLEAQFAAIVDQLDRSIRALSRAERQMAQPGQERQAKAAAWAEVQDSFDEEVDLLRARASSLSDDDFESECNNFAKSWRSRFGLT